MGVMLFAGSVAWACGATVCGSGATTTASTAGTTSDGGAVVQSGERIVFVQEDDGWSAFVQILTQGTPGKFGWVVPLPEAIDPSDVTIAPDGMMDDLELATAPAFRTDDGLVSGAAAPTSSGCGCDAGIDDLLLDAVSVVGSAVVGPYEITVVNGRDPEGLVAWFLQGGYDVPLSTWPLVDQYVARDYSFLAIRMLPAANVLGTVQTLKFPCGMDDPSIPISLTSVAALSNMPITAYVLADRRYEPANDWPEVEFDPSGVTVSNGATDYVTQVIGALDAGGGRGFRTEFAGPVDLVFEDLDRETKKALGHGAYLTRLQTWVSPDEMLSDPEFVPSADGAPDVDNVIDLRSKGAAGMGLFAPALLGILGLLRRRARS